MTRDQNLRLLSDALSVDHSARSVTKYRDLERLLAELTNLAPQEIYATYPGKASRVSVRAEQSQRSRSAKLLVLILGRHDHDDAMLRAARQSASKSRRPVLLLQQARDGQTWSPSFGLAIANDRDATSLMDRITAAFGEFKLIYVHPLRNDTKQHRRARRASAPLPFRVERRGSVINSSPKGMLLVPDSWNDYGYTTSYTLHYRDGEGSVTQVGQVKIGMIDLEAGEHPPIPSKFSQLPAGFFSLGQDDSYYEALATLGIHEQVLEALRDIAFDEISFLAAEKQPVAQVSLLRSVPLATVEGQFRRMAHGGARLTNFEFNYKSPGSPRNALDLNFCVRARSMPPTNIQVIIGSNGVGKTTLLKGMAAGLAPHGTRHTAHGGTFSSPQVDGVTGEPLPPFSSVVFVSFSAFDPFTPPSEPEDETGIDLDGLFELNLELDSAMPISYIGLRRPAVSDRSADAPMKSLDELATDFIESLTSCLRSAALRGRWKQAISTFDSDPILRDAQLSELASAVGRAGVEDIEQELYQLFDGLSSGHKIVLLTITRLVESLRERSLVLIDEPEAHLHPPLLAAFIRSLSNLLVDRNAAAIIATHSPVVLQEVPQDCVWKLRRSGAESRAEHPLIQTYGENVGILTREVFGLEVTQSGYHSELRRVVSKSSTFEEVMDRFGGQLGSEAQGIVRILLAMRAKGGGR